MATNLETLELTINANAESASQGLSNLINSLSALTKPVGKAFGGLKMLNAELAKLKGIWLNQNPWSKCYRVFQQGNKQFPQNHKSISGQSRGDP